jgi:hypothetical protein
MAPPTSVCWFGFGSAAYIFPATHVAMAFSRPSFFGGYVPIGSVPMNTTHRRIRPGICTSGSGSPTNRGCSPDTSCRQRDPRRPGTAQRLVALYRNIPALKSRCGAEPCSSTANTIAAHPDRVCRNGALNGPESKLRTDQRTTCRTFLLPPLLTRAPGPSPYPPPPWRSPLRSASRPDIAYRSPCKLPSQRHGRAFRVR